MKDYFKYDNLKRLIIVWAKAFGIAVVFEILTVIGLPAFTMVFVIAGIWLLRK